MPVIRQASGMRTVSGAGKGELDTLCFLGTDQQSGVRLGEALPNQVNEGLVAFQPQLPGLAIEWRLVGDQRQLMLDEDAQRFGDNRDMIFEPLLATAQSIEAHAEPLVELIAGTAIKPGIERIGKNGGLGRARLCAQRLELFRQIVGQIELMAGLERLQGASVATGPALRTGGIRRTGPPPPGILPPGTCRSYYVLGAPRRISAHHIPISGPPRSRPDVQLIPPARTTPEICWPIRRSSTGRHGTSVNSFDFSTIANFLSPIVTGPRQVPCTRSPSRCSTNDRRIDALTGDDLSYQFGTIVELTYQTMKRSLCPDTFPANCPCRGYKDATLCSAIALGPGLPLTTYERFKVTLGGTHPEFIVRFARLLSLSRAPNNDWYRRQARQILLQVRVRNERGALESGARLFR